MKSLLLMRHSYAVSDNPAFHDRERPLTDHGRDMAVKTGALLKSQAISRIIFSSAVRTTETAELIAAACDISETHAVDSLYLAGSVAYRDAAAACGTDSDSAILVVGHNPGIASLIASWAGDHLPVTPCTVACFDIPVHDWRELPHAVPKLVEFISEGKRQTLP